MRGMQNLLYFPVQVEKKKKKKGYTLHIVHPAHNGQFLLLKDAFGKFMVTALLTTRSVVEEHREVTIALFFCMYSSRACVTFNLHHSSLALTPLFLSRVKVFKKKKKKNLHAPLCAIHLLGVILHSCAKVSVFPHSVF